MRFSGWLLSIVAITALASAADHAWGQTSRVSARQEPVESPSDQPPLPPNGATNGAASGGQERGGPYARQAPGGVSPYYQPTPYSSPYGAHPAGPPAPYGHDVYDGGPVWNGHPCWQEWGCTMLPSFWARVDYLHWWRKGQEHPPLLTEGGTGVLGEPGTVLIFGDEEVDGSPRPGARLDLGAWLDSCQRWGLGFRIWGLGDSTIDFSRESAGTAASPILARPFIDPLTGQEEASIVAGPDAGGVFAAGRVDINADSHLAGGDLYLRRLMWADGCSRIDFVTGWQHSRIDDSLTVFSSRQIQPTPFNVTDTFDARNEFNGGILGVLVQQSHGCWTLEALAKVGIGNMNETVTITGASTGAQPTRGFLAQPSNIGTFEQSEFAVSPEVAVTANWQVLQNVEVAFGYTFIYWSKAVQAGSQIDRTLDLVQAPGATRPRFDFQSTEFWTQGFNVGLNWRY